MNEEQRHIDRNDLYAGIVWVVSALALVAYGATSALNASVPGVEGLVDFLGSVDRKYIYIAAIASIFIEGLYFVGSFFPGSSLVVVLAILSQVGGLESFAITISLIFVGWCLAGIANICLATLYRRKVIRLHDADEYEVKDHVWSTWFPAFRASYEVAQVASGGNPFDVFLSSLRVRVWATLFMAAVTLLVPLFIDINETTDREGYVTIATVAAISLYVGVRKICRYYRRS